MDRPGRRTQVQWEARRRGCDPTTYCGTDNVCHAHATLGQSCPTAVAFPCDGSTYCASDGVCRARAKSGTSCLGGPGGDVISCLDADAECSSVTGNLCLRMHGEGESCGDAANTTMCTPNLVCGSDLRCHTAPVAAGVVCKTNTGAAIQCQPGTYCTSGGKCHALLGEGEPCPDNTGCDGDTVCAPGVGHGACQ